MRRTNSENEPGGLGSPNSLLTSQSFPSLSDTVLKQLGALMEEVKQKELSEQIIFKLNVMINNQLDIVNELLHLTHKLYLN